MFLNHFLNKVSILYPLKTLVRKGLIFILSINLVEDFLFNEDFQPFALRLLSNIMLKISSSHLEIYSDLF